MHLRRISLAESAKILLYVGLIFVWLFCLIDYVYILSIMSQEAIFVFFFIFSIKEKRWWTLVKNWLFRMRLCLHFGRISWIFTAIKVKLDMLKVSLLFIKP